MSEFAITLTKHSSTGHENFPKKSVMLNSSTSVDWSGNDFTVFDDFPTTSNESHRRTSYLNRKRYKKLHRLVGSNAANADLR